ncbi:unnamed protein product [Schistosoma margrebowiei]|uniref:Uncharacterized protein n=1 Tax=Schistosoma margrebowiei TaxID=48269 RepID=A0A183NAI3_9TREM|nr:unnamed protein product [Schistosoma margrebowiei]
MVIGGSQQETLDPGFVLMSNLQTYKKSNSVKYYNYASLIKKLPIPAKLRAFLSYCDLWPDLDRSQVKVVKGNQFHRNQITDTMINNIFYENIEL